MKKSVSIKESKKLFIQIQDSSRNDTIHLATIFPEELWVAILDKIQDPEQLENCSKVTPFFHRLLEPRRVEYLFPKVLGTLINWTQSQKQNRNKFGYRLACKCKGADSSSSSNDEEENSDDDDDDVDKVKYCTKDNAFSGAGGHFSTTLQTLRLVCHCWSKGVEMFLVKYPSHFEFCEYKHRFRNQVQYFNDSDSDSESEEDQFAQHFLPCFIARDIQQVLQFLEMIENFPKNKNPLFHRKLIIQDNHKWSVSRTEIRSFWQCITCLLQRYGEYIWYCDIRLKQYTMGCSYYFAVREWLALMPNVKVIHWTFHLTWGDFNAEESEGYQSGYRFPVFLRPESETIVGENPLPTLEQLQVFKTDDLPYFIFREFVNKNKHISKLQFHRNYEPPAKYKQFYKYDFINNLRNIKELSVVVWKSREVRELGQERDGVVAWPLLQKLSVYWEDYSNLDEESYYPRWAQVFSLVKKKCATCPLTDLILHLPKRQDDRDWLSENINFLPRLCCLTVWISENCSLDFILPFNESLEELYVIVECTASWNWQRKQPSVKVSKILCAKQTIQFTGYFCRMFQSNIWKLFEKLKKIHLMLINRLDYGSRKMYTYRR